MERANSPAVEEAASARSPAAPAQSPAAEAALSARMPEEAEKPRTDTALPAVAEATSIPGLAGLTSGPPPRTTAERLKQMTVPPGLRFLQLLRRTWGSFARRLALPHRISNRLFPQ